MKNQLKAMEKDALANALAIFLSNFTSPAFGSMPKREIELSVFEMMQALELIDNKSSLYDLMTQLRVTRTKASQLLFDTEVRRLGTPELERLLNSALVRPRFAKDGDYYILEIENPLVHAYLKEKLRKLNHISDTSFNSAIIRMPVEAVVDLIADQLTKKECEEVRIALISAGAPDTSWKGVLRSSLKKLGSKLMGKAADGLVDQASEYLEPLMQSTGGTIKEVWTTIWSSNDRDEKKAQPRIR